MIKLVKIALILFTLVSCTKGSAPQTSPTSNTKMLTQGTLEIELDLIPSPTVPANWDSDYSISFTRKIIEGNLPSQIKIAWDENQYRKDQLDNQMNWLSWSSEFYDREAGRGLFCKEHQYLPFCIPFTPDWTEVEEIEEEEEEEVDEPSIELVEEFKEILGYRCQKANWKSDSESWEIWFSPDLKLPEQWSALWGKPGIPGLALEMKAGDEPRRLVQEHYRVIGLNTDAPTNLKMEGGDRFQLFGNSASAKGAIENKASAVASKQPVDMTRFLGPWKLDSEEDKVFLTVNRLGEKYQLAYYYPTREKKIAKVIWGEQGFYQKEGSDIILMQLSGDGNSLTRADHPAFKFDKISEREFQKWRLE